jgi:hypothetical protein
MDKEELRNLVRISWNLHKLLYRTPGGDDELRPLVIDLYKLLGRLGVKDIRDYLDNSSH